jgi:hypothetical protein
MTIVHRKAINLKRVNNRFVYLTVKSVLGISCLSDLLWFISQSLFSVVTETRFLKQFELTETNTEVEIFKQLIEINILVINQFNLYAE